MACDSAILSGSGAVAKFRDASSGRADRAMNALSHPISEGQKLPQGDLAAFVEDLLR
jgi:hypothetical protein